MVFACQENSFLKEFTSQVVSCVPATMKIGDGKNIKPTAGFEIVCGNTVLFPEGGGQPSDHGFLNDIPVLHIGRRGTEAVHFVEKEIPVGATVLQKVDWVRREDHMQQHSGQHLITALADLEFGFKTTSWWLGDQVSYIELDTPTMSDDQVHSLESLVNQKIKESLPVDVKVYQPGDPKLLEAKTRGLPEGHEGAVRVISISGLDNNMCCGTHVSNLSQLQAIKLLFAEKGKKGKINLHFLSGNRVLSQLGTCLEREKQMTTLLKNNPSEHVDLVDKLQKSMKIYQKNAQSLLKDLAVLEAEKIKQMPVQPKYICIHRKEGDPDFARILTKSLPEEMLKLVTWGEKNEGQMHLNGPAELVSELGPKICEILKGKGASKGVNFMAKITALTVTQLAIVEKLLQDCFVSRLQS